jgi:hypothetical protein
MIHNWTQQQYLHINSIPKLGGIDIGNFMTRTSLSSTMRLNTKNEVADGIFVQEFLAKYPTGVIKKINKPLYVHN